jgi:hypothetical protein
VFTKDDGNPSPHVFRYVNEPINNLTITEEGTQKLLNNIQTSKATGPDNLPNRVLKDCSIEMAPAIRAIFQKFIDSGTLPEVWTNANEAPIFKKGDRHQPSNYRPVSLTSVISNLLEHIVCKHEKLL